MQAFYSDETEAIEEAQEVFELLELAGVNTEQLGFITTKLREEIDAEQGVPDPYMDRRATPQVSARERCLTARLNYLMANSWKLSIPIGSDIPLYKMLPQLESGCRELQGKSKYALLRMAREAAQERARENALRK